jgi:hypothetical protein
MIRFVVAPDESKATKDIKLFLAGGITGCPDWQAEIMEKMFDDSEKFDYLYNVIVFNPRRQYFPKNSKDESEKQITWEYKGFEESDIIAFWFPKETINPIVLYELGKWGNSSKKTIIIGIDEGYERKADVEIQTKLARPEVNIVYTLKDFYYEILLEIKKLNK